MPDASRDTRFSLIQGLHLMRDPLGFVREGVRRHGEPFIGTLPTGRAAFTSSSEAMKQLFTVEPSTFSPYAQAFLEPALGRNSLLLLDAARHKRERKLIMPSFHGERMRAYGSLMQECAERVFESLQPGAVRDVQAMNQDISLTIIIRAVLGASEPEQVRRISQTFLAYAKSYTPVIAMITPLRRSFGGVGPWARFQRLAREIDALLTELIERRRAEGPREDILSLLMSAHDEEGRQMTDRELKDELITLLVTGHETTAISMTWALYWLHRNPEVKQRLEQELAPLGSRPEPEALVKLPYLSAVCDETLRLTPLAPMIVRSLAVPFTLLGKELPAGIGLMASVLTIHADPDIYPEPERFQPERFLERRYSPFEYIPFGGGARRCVGAAFGLYEMKVVLGTLVARHRFSLVNERPIAAVFRNVVMAPKESVRLRYEGSASPRALVA